MRLIDADTLKAFLNEKLDAAITRNAESIGEIEYYSSLATLIAVTDCISSVNEQPTVDAVEVVRCKDCEHRPAFRNDDGGGYVEGPKYQETLKNGLTVTLEDTRCPCVNGLDSYFSYIPEDDWFCKNGERRAEE